MVPVAQLVRASRCGREGCAFESRRAPHYGKTKNSPRSIGGLFLF